MSVDGQTYCIKAVEPQSGEFEGSGEMPRISAKGQVTLPASQRKAVGLMPGDEIETFVADGQITIVKKIPGAAKGILKHARVKSSVSDELSVDSTLS